MPRMMSLSLVIYSIKYVPSADRATYIGDIDSLDTTDTVSTVDSAMLS